MTIHTYNLIRFSMLEESEREGKKREGQKGIIFLLSIKVSPKIPALVEHRTEVHKMFRENCDWGEQYGEGLPRSQK